MAGGSIKIHPLCTALYLRRKKKKNKGNDRLLEKRDSKWKSFRFQDINRFSRACSWLEVDWLVGFAPISEQGKGQREGGVVRL